MPLLKTGKVKGIRLATLNSICEFLDCQPGDILEYRPDTSSQETGVAAQQAKSVQA